MAGNAQYPHPILAKEGWPFIGIAVFLAFLIHYLGSFAWALPFYIIAVFIIQFFRDPARDIPTQVGAVLSPADGRVIVVEKTHDVYADREALKISVFMNVFNVHSNRMPVDGEVVKAHYFPGQFINADLEKASLQNERNALVIRTTDGQIVTSVQVAGLIARRILCYVGVGHLAKRGERYGFIRFGSRVDIYLPTDAVPCVTIGDRVSASSTILAKLTTAASVDAGTVGNQV
ncbi:phosphatidylserine decarboxylase proenzyme [Formosimonas limnophila]|uniref:Phosphatidylserine decarboxylase proenzyme n=1 Tax=Formosimonas limnophila TaxID=1384487 RepID=A0A8J3G006_9BURK|nr:phosphatidylserine decarboxylase [Formosimonas limnophila]GHA67653.1 phosphatidylserine decarboxylase proenzyme [Formosimonas limnophila]